MAPKEKIDDRTAAARERAYHQGGPSQMWLCYCPTCARRFTARSERAVLEHRADHTAHCHPQE